jgi:hypothetical protein
LNWKRLSLPNILLWQVTNWKGGYINVVYLDEPSNSRFIFIEGYTMGNIQKSCHSNILTISGAGRNVGKTSLACRIIEKLAGTHKLTAVKISPHFHQVDYPNALFEKPGAYSLYRENKKDREKDSSKMLAAGADPVYYIQTNDVHLSDAWKKLSEVIGDDEPVVVESGALKKLLDPGLSIIVMNPESKGRVKQGSSGSDEIETRFGKFDLLINNISYNHGRWQLNN